MTKNDSEKTVTSSNDPEHESARVEDAPKAEVRNTPLPDVPDATNASVDGYKLTKLKEDEVVVPGVVTLEVVAEGTFKSSTGEVLRTGDRKLVNRADAAALLDVKVNGKSAFKAV